MNPIPKKLLQRKKKSHKGDYGRILILAGSRSYSGAAYLAGVAALRLGAGLVTLGVPKSIHAIVARRQPELIVRPFSETSEGSLALKSKKEILKLAESQDVLAVGPGLSQNPETQKLIREVISKTIKPVILDADGLNAFQNHPEKLRVLGNRGILTPHPGEFSRLFGGKLTDDESLRKKRALDAAKQTGCVIVLKGHRTVVANPLGKCYVNTTGNPGMAKAGTGDVLTGMIAAFVGQGLPVWEAACTGVNLHGLAGDLAVKSQGLLSLLATDLLDFLPQALQKISR